MDSGDPQAKPMQKRRFLVIGSLVGLFFFICLLISGLFLWNNLNGRPRLAPEADQVLSAQVGLPFQALIPAYLPAHFDREKVEIQLDQTGPGGEPMLQLSYPTPKGNRWCCKSGCPKMKRKSIPAPFNASCVCVARAMSAPPRWASKSVRCVWQSSSRRSNLLTYEQLQLRAGYDWARCQPAGLFQDGRSAGDIQPAARRWKFRSTPTGCPGSDPGGDSRWV